MAEKRTYKAIVQKVYATGPHGPYAVASSEELGSITFSLDKRVWQEDDLPERGMSVALTDLREKRAGWRAQHGRFWEPSDESPQQRARKER